MTTFTLNKNIKPRPPRITLKHMVNAGMWEELGELYNFTPVYAEEATGKKTIDWKCVPQRLYANLGKKHKAKMELALYGKTAISKNVESAATDSVPSIPKARKPKRKLHDRTHRERLYLEQSGQCHYCGEHTLLANWTVDHRIPLAREGFDGPSNLVGSCKNCNNRKAILTEEEFLPIMFDSDACKKLHSQLQNQLKNE